MYRAEKKMVEKERLVQLCDGAPKVGHLKMCSLAFCTASTLEHPAKNLKGIQKEIPPFRSFLQVSDTRCNLRD